MARTLGWGSKGRQFESARSDFNLMKKISAKTVEYIAKLANIPVTEKEKQELAEGFNKTLEVIDALFKVDVSNILTIYQVTGMENIFREDEIDEEKMLSQDQALANAKRKYQGYFVVDQILAED